MARGGIEVDPAVCYYTAHSSSRGRDTRDIHDVYENIIPGFFSYPYPLFHDLQNLHLHTLIENTHPQPDTPEFPVANHT